jgi:hypothetical protein
MKIQTIITAQVKRMKNRIVVNHNRNVMNKLEYLVLPLSGCYWGDNRLRNTAFFWSYCFSYSLLLQQMYYKNNVPGRPINKEYFMSLREVLKTTVIIFISSSSSSSSGSTSSTSSVAVMMVAL